MAKKQPDVEQLPDLDEDLEPGPPIMRPKIEKRPVPEPDPRRRHPTGGRRPRPSDVEGAKKRDTAEVAAEDEASAVGAGVDAAGWAGCTAACFDLLVPSENLLGVESKALPLGTFLYVLASAVHRVPGFSASSPDGEYFSLVRDLGTFLGRGRESLPRYLVIVMVPRWSRRDIPLPPSSIEVLIVACARTLQRLATEPEGTQVIEESTDAHAPSIRGILTLQPPRWHPVQVPKQEQDRTPIDEEAALPAVPEGMEDETVSALAAVVEKLTALAQAEPENLLDDVQQIKDISQEFRAILAPRVAAVLNRFAGTAYTYAEKQEVAKQVNAMLRDLGLQLRSPTGEPVPLVTNPGGERNREGLFIVGRGEGSTTTKYPHITLMPAPPKKPRGE
jgi:hypothetical protein